MLRAAAVPAGLQGVQTQLRGRHGVRRGDPGAQGHAAALQVRRAKGHQVYGADKR